MAVFLLTSIFALLSSFAAASPSRYVPSFVECPQELDVRPACGGLSDQEQAWRSRRIPEVFKALKNYLGNAKIPGFDMEDYLAKISPSSAPIAGLAISGGGAQSGMNGLGIWQAFDQRYPPAVKAGTGGLVQCLSYFTGLSGGAIWTVFPLAGNNLSSVAELRVDADLTSNTEVGPSGNETQFLLEIFENSLAKQREGFSVSANEILGQFYRQFYNPSMSYGNISDFAKPDTAFFQGLAPMPIGLYTEVIPGHSPELKDIMYPAPNISTIYEVNPFEFGSWIGGRVQAFFPTRFLGTKMNHGHPANSSICVKGFDKITAIAGASGNAFNLWFTEAFYGFNGFYKRNTIPIPSADQNNSLVEFVEKVDKVFNITVNQSLWDEWPNPFANYGVEMMNVDDLLIVDGSEAGETIPLRPLIIPERGVDFIVAYDSSGEYLQNDFVNGTTFGQSAKVAHNLGLPFPEVPDSATFINLGLNRYPTFFGCNASVDTPLVLYLPNSPWSAYSNYSYMKPEFSNKQLDIIFENSLNLATFGQGKLESEKGTPPFSACIACGLISKSLKRTGQKLPVSCQTCFERHCWNGTVADSPAYPDYNPSLLLNPGLDYTEWKKQDWHV